MCGQHGGDLGCTDYARRRFLTRSVLAGAGLLAAPLLLPQSAEAGGLFDLTPSAGDQKKVGEQGAQQVLKQYREVHDSRATHFQEIGRRLVAALPREDQGRWDYRFHVLDSKEVNAFALPGGPMFMYTGLYEKMTSDDALAAVTGHEMTHVRKQHWAKAYGNAQARQLGIGLLLGLTHASRNIQNLAGAADTFWGLRYSRGEEDQADEGGLNDMVAAGYNPQGMIDLFRTLKQISGNGDVLGTDLFSNHPLTTARIDHTQQRVARLKSGHSYPPLTPLHYSALR